MTRGNRKTEFRAKHWQKENIGHKRKQQENNK